MMPEMGKRYHGEGKKKIFPQDLVQTEKKILIAIPVERKLFLFFFFFFFSPFSLFETLF